MASDNIWRLIRASRAIAEDAGRLWLPPEEITQPTRQPVISTSIVRGSRGYIERIVHQINATYDASCYDACSVMIRKLVETLIIEAFEYHKVDHIIKNQQGDFIRLADMIEKTLDCKSWNLGREAKRSLPKLKAVGDRSAHSRRYTAHRTDVDNIIDPLRVVVQELVTLASLK